jgi:hypothetical protein
MTFLSLDVARRDREVDEITQGDFFQDLKQKAHQLRSQREPL